MRRTMRHTSGGCVCMVRGADRAERWARDFLTVADIEIASELCVSCVLVCGGERSQIAMRAGTQSHVSEKNGLASTPHTTDDEYRHTASTQHRAHNTYGIRFNTVPPERKTDAVPSPKISLTCRSSLSLACRPASPLSPPPPYTIHTSSLTPLTPAPHSPYTLHGACT